MKSKFWDILKTYLIITVGGLIVACGVYFFSFPNNFSTGGTSALSVLLAKIIGIEAITPGLIMAVVNVILLTVALIIFGKGFAFKTVYCSLLISLFSLIMERALPIRIIANGMTTLTDDPLLELVFSIGCIALGSAITFSVGASSGGTDIVAMILKKYTNLDISRALFASDALLVLASFFIFDIRIGLYSLLGLILKSFIVDIVIDGIYLTKCFYIITSRDKEIVEFINNKLHRGATVSMCTGSFTHEDKKIIITVLKKNSKIFTFLDVACVTTKAEGSWQFKRIKVFKLTSF